MTLYEGKFIDLSDLVKFAFMGTFLQLYRFVRYYYHLSTNKPYWMTSTSTLNQASPAAQVEAKVEVEIEAG